MRRLVVAGALAWSTCSTAGCYWLASYGDLTSGLGTSQDAGTVDARVDAGGGGDANTMVDASPDTGPYCPIDAGPLSYCEDFDSVDIDAAALGQGLGANIGDAAIVSNVALSKPNSLYVEIDGQGGSGTYHVPFPFTPRTSRLEYRLMVAAVGPQWVTLSCIALHDPNSDITRVLNTVINPSSNIEVQEYFVLPDGGNEQSSPDPVPLEAGPNSAEWHDVVLTLNTDDSTQTYTFGLTVDGQVLYADQPLGLSWAQGNAAIDVGVTYGGGGGSAFYFDNVRADFGL